MFKTAAILAAIKVIAHPAFQGAVAIVALIVAIVGLLFGIM